MQVWNNMRVSTFYLMWTVPLTQHCQMAMKFIACHNPPHWKQALLWFIFQPTVLRMPWNKENGGKRRHPPRSGMITSMDGISKIKQRQKETKERDMLFRFPPTTFVPIMQKGMSVKNDDKTWCIMASYKHPTNQILCYYFQLPNFQNTKSFPSKRRPHPTFKPKG